MESLLRTIKGLESYDSTAFSELVITGTGFSGTSRANLRALCSASGQIQYCGDLSGLSTHLIVADNCNESRKIQVAAKWGLPIVRLQWLLDSIQQGEPLCGDPYLIKVTRTDTTPAANVPAPRPPPRLSSHHGSNRTPLQSVTEQLENLTFTPKESGNFKSPVPMEIQQEEERITSPQSPALLETKLSPGETPTASPCRTELPSEMAVVIDEDYCSPSMIPAPETELETDDEEEEEDESDEQQVVAVAVEESSAAVSVSVSSQSKQKSGGHYWCDNQDSLWVPGSQPRTAETPLTPELSLQVESSSEEKSFSFGIPADAPDYGTAPLLPSQTPFLLPEETPWMPFQVPAFTDKEEEEEKENETPLPLSSPVAEEMLLPVEEEKERTPDLSSMTPLSDMTPIDLQQPDLTKTRIADSPSSEDGSSKSKDVAENIQHCFSPVSTAAEHIIVVENGIHETSIQHGGQPEPEWWEDGDEEEDWGCVDIIDETHGGGCTSPPREVEDKTTRSLDGGHGLDGDDDNDDNNEEDGEEPSPISIACSNQDDNDDSENELEDCDLPLLPLPLSPQQQHQQKKKQHEIESESQRDEFSNFSESEDQIARFVRARAPLPPLPPLPSGLPQPEDDAVPLKVLQRAPRGSTVKARYRLASTKTVTFSETIHLRGKQLTLNVKDKQQAVVLASLDLDSDTDEEDDEDDLIIVEPVSFYRCQGEDTQMEYYRLFTLKQALSLARKAGVQLRLPPGFDASVELLKSTAREHVDMRKVTGTVAVRKAKLGVNALKTKSAQGGKPGYYWRCEFDADVPEVLIP